MKSNKLFALILIISLFAGGSVAKVYSQSAPSGISGAVAANSQVQYTNVGALDVVANPFRYLHRNIKIRGKFDKFSTLGLDYPPALRPSDKYISFLIQRPDILDHNIPLSELKIFINRNEAEKYIELNSGDIIEFTGRVFSTALGDPWMDATNFTVISSKPKSDK